MSTSTGSCSTSGKRSYPDELRAIAAAIRCSAKRGVPLRVYECPSCHGWHLTRRKAWVA